MIATESKIDLRAGNAKPSLPLSTVLVICREEFSYMNESLDLRNWNPRALFVLQDRKNETQSGKSVTQFATQPAASPDLSSLKSGTSQERLEDSIAFKISPAWFGRSALQGHSTRSRPCFEMNFAPTNQQKVRHVTTCRLDNRLGLYTCGPIFHC
jgi:hypothetical protein